MTSKKSFTKRKVFSPPGNETISLLFAHHPIPMWVYDLQTLAFLEVNDAALEKYGYTREEFTALTLRDIRPSEDVARLLNDVMQKRPALQFSGEWRHRVKDGRLIDVEISSHTIDFNGRQAALVMAQDITERKQAEQALYESEKRFRVLIENSSDAITLLDGKGLAVYDSPAAPGMLGYGPEDWIGQDVFALMHPDDLPKIRDLFQNLVETPGARVNCTFRVCHKSGSWLWLEMVATNLLSEPAVKAIVLNYRDITERVQAEDALKESENKFKHVFDYSTAGKSITLPSGEVNVNRALCEMLGYSREELNSRKWQEITHPDDLELTQNMINTLLSGEKAVVRFTKRYIDKNGSTIWADVGTALRRDKDGNPLYFMTTINDITARKQAEERLRESELRFSTIFHSIPIPVSLAEPTTERWVEVNDAFLKATGYTRDEVIGHTFQEIKLWVHPEKRVEMRKMLLEQGRVHNFDVEIYKRNGEIGTMLITAEMVDLNNTPFLLIMGDDFTERKLAEEKIRQLNTELEKRVEERTRELREAQEQLIRHEKLAVLGQLAGGVGHELRNPLAIINNAVYYLKLVQPDADDKTRQYFGMIEHEVYNAEKIITDLLDFARLKSVDQEPVSVPELVHSVLERYPAPPSVDVTLDFPGALPKVFADQRQMEQVLGNLVVNACQAMVNGGRLKISGQRSTFSDGLPVVSIQVKDTGTGISPENMKKLFEPLFTTKPRGIGLGLAVSRKLAEANGGRIEVQSEPGQGSTFILYLPIHEDT